MTFYYNWCFQIWDFQGSAGKIDSLLDVALLCTHFSLSSQVSAKSPPCHPSFKNVWHLYPLPCLPFSLPLRVYNIPIVVYHNFSEISRSRNKDKNSLCYDVLQVAYSIYDEWTNRKPRHSEMIKYYEDIQLFVDYGSSYTSCILSF